MQDNWKTIKKGDYLYGLVPNHPNATKSFYMIWYNTSSYEGPMPIWPYPFGSFKEWDF